MGRGDRSKSLKATELLYGRRAKGQGPVRQMSDEEKELLLLDELISEAPPLPQEWFDKVSITNFGDDTYDQVEWLNNFAKRSLLSDSFSDTAVEEEIIDGIYKSQNEQFKFTAKDWASPFVNEPKGLYQQMIDEGKAIASVIESFQESDLEVSRDTMSKASQRIALRVALARLLRGIEDPDQFSWREKQTLRSIRSMPPGVIEIDLPSAVLDSD